MELNNRVIFNGFCDRRHRRSVRHRSNRPLNDLRRNCPTNGLNRDYRNPTNGWNRCCNYNCCYAGIVLPRSFRGCFRKLCRRDDRNRTRNFRSDGPTRSRPEYSRNCRNGSCVRTRSHRNILLPRTNHRRRGDDSRVARYFRRKFRNGCHVRSCRGCWSIRSSCLRADGVRREPTDGNKPILHPSSRDNNGDNPIPNPNPTRERSIPSSSSSKDPIPRSRDNSSSSNCSRNSQAIPTRCSNRRDNPIRN